ncbi:mannose-6-phosphate isomerase, class I [Paenibacillus turpanensis]|uniref:mannose-6-phosphate isomerase, class I n=1 Tax=Paenibacillus turpanensis TaxID=2689078 RepID=UPI0014095417|nr:mannose-6-phosphate isomerase, class I [Paenibacillus turpanensis]
MKVEPLFLDPVFKERIWGGTKLRDSFGFDIPSNTTGEAWTVSAHENGQSIVRNGQYKGQKLGDLWNKHPEIFGEQGSEFPLLIKILDASKDLSIQVHPSDDYARVYENGGLGKTECWYILECDPDAEIVFGHHAETKEQLKKLIQSGDWESLLTRVKVSKGDFFYVPSGTLHALGKGIVVLETQQSSDITYRVYDYDRRDDQGNLRELHLSKAIDVLNVPNKIQTNSFTFETMEFIKKTTFISNSYFTVQKLDISGTAEFEHSISFIIYSVIEGNGVLEFDKSQYPLVKGDTFIIPVNQCGYKISGDIELILSKL